MRRKPTTVVKCPACGKKFRDNPNKHRFRKKESPCCRVTYTSGSPWLGGLDFRRVKEPLQKLFSFFPKITSKKEVYYHCPKCNSIAAGRGQIKIKKLPEKTTQVIVENKVTIVPITWREVPTCKKCGSYLVRKTRKR